jgi:hypothetical protein
MTLFPLLISMDVKIPAAMFACATRQLIKFINILIFTRFQHEKSDSEKSASSSKKSRICEATKNIFLYQDAQFLPLCSLCQSPRHFRQHLRSCIITFHNLAIAFIEIVNCIKRENCGVEEELI